MVLGGVTFPGVNIVLVPNIFNFFLCVFPFYYLRLRSCTVPSCVPEPLRLGLLLARISSFLRRSSCGSLPTWDLRRPPLGLGLVSLRSLPLLPWVCPSPDLLGASPPVWVWFVPVFPGPYPFVGSLVQCPPPGLRVISPLVGEFVVLTSGGALGLVPPVWGLDHSPLVEKLVIRFSGGAHDLLPPVGGLVVRCPVWVLAVRPPQVNFRIFPIIPVSSLSICVLVQLLCLGLDLSITFPFSGIVCLFVVFLFVEYDFCGRFLSL